MTYEETLQVVTDILEKWPGGEWTKEQMKAYAAGILDLDYDYATAALLRAQKELKFRPKVAELREYVALERKQTATDPEGWRSQPAEKPLRPDWEARWRRARAAGDNRMFPEQVRGYIENGYQVPQVPLTDAEVFVQPTEYAPTEKEE